MAYLLDTNVFIEAKDYYYDLDVCPGFWDWLDAQSDAGRVLSIGRVATEIEAREDRLFQWAAPRQHMFMEPDESVFAALEQVATWANQSGYSSSAIDAFLRKADSYLVAHALAGGHTVVTHEVVQGKKHNIKIPVACGAFTVRCMNPFEMLRIEHATFVLGARA